jgi:hypothetical protein
MLAALLAGCADETVVPTEEVGVPSLGAADEEFVWEFPYDPQDVYDECANGGQGEVVNWYGAYDVIFRRVTTPSGNNAWKWFIDYYAHPSGMIGQTTQDVWVLDKANDTGAAIQVHCDPSPCPGDGPIDPMGSDKLNFHWRGIEWYENQDGERIRYNLAGHLMVTNGEVVEHERSVFKCEYFPARP